VERGRRGGRGDDEGMERSLGSVHLDFGGWIWDSNYLPGDDEMHCDGEVEKEWNGEYT
jgi:hypothetical protein